LDIHWLLLPIVLIFLDIYSSKHVNHVVEQ
jgi:hypothetical protein